MINETINQTISMPSYIEVSNVTQSPAIIVALILVTVLPLFIYLIFGALMGARTVDGRKIATRMIQHKNFWIVFAIFFITLSIMISLIIFPIWLKIFE